MSKLYAFSPITSKIQFDEAVAYVVRETGRLSQELTGTKLRLRTVKVFAHYPGEYDILKELIREYGKPSKIGRSTSIYVATSLDIEDSHLDHLGIRLPDPYRMQVGCGDYDVESPEQFVASLPISANGYIRQFPEMKDKFVELWHPDFDVAGYIAV